MSKSGKLSGRGKHKKTKNRAVKRSDRHKFQVSLKKGEHVKVSS